MHLSPENQRLTLLVLALIVATITLILSYPRLTSSLTYLAVDAALKHQWDDYPIKPNQFPGLIETARHSIEQLDENLKVLEKGPLGEDEMARLREFGRIVHG